MKFRVSLVLFYLIAYCFGTINSRSRGRNKHFSGPTHVAKDSKYWPKTPPEVSFKYNGNIRDPVISKRTLKQNANKPIKILSNPLIVTNRNEDKYPNISIVQEPKISSMDVGKHLVKVSSVLHSKHLDIQPKEGSYEISVNPKFSHVIEILPINEPSTKNKKDFTQPEVLDESFENVEQTIFQQLDKDSKFHRGLNDKETSTETYSETQCLTSSEETYQSFDSEELKPRIFNTEENLELRTRTEISEGTATLHSDSEAMSDNTISAELEGRPRAVSDETTFNDELEDRPHAVSEDETILNDELEGRPHAVSDDETTLNDELEGRPRAVSDDETTLNDELEGRPRAVSDDETTLNDELEGRPHVVSGDETPFSDELEGSGEEFSAEEFGSGDTESNQDATKDGRILSLFSQRNDSSPVCTTPKGESGECRRIRQCLLSEALNNFNIFLQHLCLIRGALVGICCPDNPVIEITNPDENITASNEEIDIKQPPEGCGLNTKTRIVGGSISGPNEWTWMVALLRRNRFFCGGVIINNWYILTAAHCVLGLNVQDLTVRLGEYDFTAHSEHKEDISIAEIKRHAQFVTLTFQHDIALLKLQRSIRYSKFVGSICLPTQKARDYSDVEGTVVGWGTVSFGGSASPILRQVTVPVWKNEDCDNTYLIENISDSFMCAGSPEKGEDACQGDSGGPLMTLNDGGRWEVIGLVSWGRRCGDPKYPGVYTRVTTYLDWILQNMN